MPRHLNRLAIWFGLSLAVLALLYNSRGGSRTVPTPLVPPRAPVVAPTTETREPEASEPVARTRHDADYWPQRPYPIPMRYRTLQPSRDLPKEEHLTDNREVVWLVQFGGPLTSADLMVLQQQQIDVLLPSVANAFHARASHAALTAAVADFAPLILGWARLRPDDKVLRALRQAEKKILAVHHLQKMIGAATLLRRVELYPRVNVDVVLATVLQLGGQVTASGRDWLEVRGPDCADFTLQIAMIEEVYAVDLPRPKLQACNQQAATAERITLAQSTPRNLTGAGITVMVRDEDRIFNHPDLAGRLTFGPDVFALTNTSAHSTHIAGTIGGTGSINATARGMAPACALVSYDYNGDDAAEPLAAKNSCGAGLSCHAYSFATGWNDGVFIDNQNTFGAYSTFARNWDAVIKSDNLLMVKAVGNDRNDSGTGHPHDGTLGADGEYYDATDASSTSKNILCIGATSDTAQAGTPSAALLALPGSSSGPCDDGRLRPEIVANGDALFSCNNSAVASSEYFTSTGSSMSAGVVTGATALFLEYYQRRYSAGSCCTPFYLRALYAQTATDLGRSGPDYLHGFGMLDFAAALDLFDANTGNNCRLLNGTLSATTAERYYLLVSDGTLPIKATLCWNDEPGDILAAKALVNDLDMRLIRISDQVVFYPFKLDPAIPTQAATTGVNSVDTIEQVELLAPDSGTYLLAVRGATLATPTAFTLASSHGLTENLAPVAKIISSATTGSPPLTVIFDGGSSYDPDGVIAQYQWDFGDGFTAQGVLVQHMYNKGSFQARLTVIDNLGIAASAEISIGVANKLPLAVVSASPESGSAPLSLLLSAAGSVDPDGQIVKYSWDFGDGTTGDGFSVTHTYAASGLYFVTLTITDNGGAIVQSVATVLVGQSLTLKSGSFSVKFNKINRDRFAIYSKTVPFDPALSVAGLSASIRLGTTVYRFTLNAKGKCTMAPLNIKLDPVKGYLKVVISHTTLDAILARSGATNRNAKLEKLRVPFALYLQDGSVFGSPGLPFSYTAKQDVSGNGKYLAP
ncbi:MAG: PKD domain-containing protein [Planctomycetota bacterium]